MCLYKQKYLNKSDFSCLSWESVVRPAWRDILITFWNNEEALVAIPLIRQILETERSLLVKCFLHCEKMQTHLNENCHVESS